GELARSPSNLRARAVVEGDYQVKRAVVTREGNGIVDEREQLLIYTVALADHVDAHALAVELGQIAANEAAHQAHQVIDFARRPRPVLGGEAEDGKVLQPELDGGAYGAAHGLHAHAMAGRARQPALLRPPAIAVHNDCNVARDRRALTPSGRLIMLVHKRGLVRRSGASAEAGLRAPIKVAVGNTFIPA